jgi:hypothetical protein
LSSSSLGARLAPAAQWRPTGPLASVLVVDDCHETGGDVMVSRLDPPTVYVCPTVVKLVRTQSPGAEQFSSSTSSATSRCKPPTRQWPIAGRRTSSPPYATDGARSTPPSRSFAPAARIRAGATEARKNRAERIRRCAAEELP